MNEIQICKYCGQPVEGASRPDVNTIRRPARVDVLSFGSPCQDLSVAGRRAGLDGARSGLFFQAARIIDECRPAFAVWENVPGAFSGNYRLDTPTNLTYTPDVSRREGQRCRANPKSKAT